MTARQRNLWIFIIAIGIAFVYLLFFHPQKQYFFKDTGILQDAFTNSTHKSLQLISSFIPPEATNIRISYRTNRVKNIDVSFDAANIDWSDYIGFVQSQLKNYSSSPTSIEQNDKHIFFQGNSDSYFKQIDITLEGNFITIQSF